MNDALQRILELIEREDPLSEEQRTEIKSLVKDLDRKERMVDYRVQRAENDKRVMTTMLNESIEDLEKKSRALEQQKKLLEGEKEKSEELLLNILPREIAEELKQYGKSYARKHEAVSILFADIKGFSAIAEQLSANELVTQLDECFRAFDRIVDKYDIEKIKTIGDAYVCASGLPNPLPDHAARAIQAGLDMLHFIKGFGLTKQVQELPVFDFRIGIHSGPVVTGVVGAKKFTYDIWGDTVNLAARMEQHGEAGKINVSDSTFRLIRDDFECSHRGKIEAKNKGAVDMYFVEG